MLPIAAESGERGYYLFAWGNDSGKEYLKKYRANGEIYSANKSCWKERAGNSVEIIYSNVYPSGMTNSLIKSFLLGNNKYLTTIRKSLLDFSDDQISHGFDGMIVINKNNHQIEIDTIPVIGRKYLYKRFFVVNDLDYMLFDKELCNALSPVDDYFSP